MPMMAIYIRGGTPMPMMSSARVSWALKVCDTGRAPELRVGLLLIEDRIPVIKPVEHLSETKGVFREHRKFQRSNDLLHNLIQSRRFQDERPQLMAAAFADELCRSRGYKPLEHSSLVETVAVAQLGKNVLGVYDSIL